MKYLKGWYEIKEARAKALKAQKEYEEVRNRVEDTEKEKAKEKAIVAMQRKIEALEADVKRKKGFSVSLTIIAPEAGEDPEIVAEAWRRFQKERAARIPPIGRFNRGRSG